MLDYMMQGRLNGGSIRRVAKYQTYELSARSHDG